MRLEAIFDMWEKDSKIDPARLDHESLAIPQLHGKYHKIYTYESIKLREYELKLKALRLEKYEFYTMGPTKETKEKGWELPPCGKVIKADANQYIDTDRDVVEATLQIGIQHEKLALLKSILDTIARRTFHIKNSIDYNKFIAGLS